MMTLWIATAWAGELVPMGEAEPALVRAGDGRGLFHGVPEGEAVAFPASGPTTLELVARSRDPAEAGTVALLGGGRLLLQLELSQQDAGGMVLDGRDGSPGRKARAAITVPAGDHVLKVRAVGGDALVQLLVVDEEHAAITMPEPPVLVMEQPTWPPEVAEALAALDRSELATDAELDQLDQLVGAKIASTRHWGIGASGGYAVSGALDGSPQAAVVAHATPAPWVAVGLRLSQETLIDVQELAWQPALGGEALLRQDLSATTTGAELGLSLRPGPDRIKAVIGGAGVAAHVQPTDGSAHLAYGASGHLGLATPLLHGELSPRLSYRWLPDDQLALDLLRADVAWLYTF